METVINTDQILSIKVLLHILNIFAWFWISAWTIIRVGCFKKRIFSLLILVYMSQGVTKIGDLIASDFLLNCEITGSEIMGLLLVASFYCLSSKYIRLKSKYYEKNNFSRPDDHQPPVL